MIGPTSIRRTLAAALAASALLVSGCGSDPTPTSSPSAGASSAPATMAPHDELEAPPTTASAAEQDAVTAARRFLTTWAAPDLSYGQWWPRVKPLLSPQGQQDYAAVDPANLPALTLTGKPRVEASSVATAVTVWQPTNLGEFGVRMSRTSESAAWLVAEITFPEGVH